MSKGIESSILKKQSSLKRKTSNKTKHPKQHRGSYPCFFRNDPFLKKRCNVDYMRLLRSARNDRPINLDGNLLPPKRDRIFNPNITKATKKAKTPKQRKQPKQYRGLPIAS